VVIWAASYPRAGNTMLRMLCWEVFGITSSNVYYQNDNFKRRMDYPGFMYFKDAEAIRAAWSCGAEPHLVKTHMQAEEKEVGAVAPASNKTLFVVRDGRASCVSYYHYNKEFVNAPRTLLSLAEEPYWSSLLSSWHKANPGLLLLRYEEMLNNPQTVIAGISSYLGVKAKAEWVNKFDALHVLVPSFFRKGKTDSWREEWSPELERVFMSRHGAWMEKLGYV